MPDETVAIPRGNTYDKYETSNPIERRLMRNFLASIDDLLPTPDTIESILEIGVGEGEILRRLRDRYSGATMVGIDLPDPGLTAVWRREQLDCIHADGRALPFPDASFDLVIAIESFEHIPRPEAALQEMRRVCRSSAVLSVPREPIWRVANLLRGAYVRDLGNTPGHVNHWSSQAFADFVDSAFAVDRIARPFPWTAVAATVRQDAR